MAALNEDLVFKALYETFPDPVIIIDAERIIRSANNAALRQFGYPSAEFIDRSVRLIYATDAEYAKRLQNRAARVDETAPGLRTIFISGVTDRHFPGICAPRP